MHAMVYGHTPWHAYSYTIMSFLSAHTLRAVTLISMTSVVQIYIEHFMLVYISHHITPCTSSYTLLHVFLYTRLPYVKFI